MLICLLKFVYFLFSLTANQEIPILDSFLCGINLTMVMDDFLVKNWGCYYSNSLRKKDVELLEKLIFFHQD